MFIFVIVLSWVHEFATKLYIFDLSIMTILITEVALFPLYTAGEKKFLIVSELLNHSFDPIYVVMHRVVSKNYSTKPCIKLAHQKQLSSFSFQR